MGAMIISYFLSTLLALPLLLFLCFSREVDLVTALAAACMIILITGPVIYRYSKLLWIHLEERLKH